MKTHDSESLPEEWSALLPPGIADAPLAAVARDRDDGIAVYPPAGSLFAALRLTPPRQVRAVILGQDPYHEPGQATGVAFAVPAECRKLPPSLRNILREYAIDLGAAPPAHPDLRQWCQQGVLLLNTVLSVREHAAASHAAIGWQRLTDAIIAAVSRHCPPCAFLLWGLPAQRKIPLIASPPHGVFCAPHPSPLSAYRGFFGSRPFSQANRWLRDHGRPEIDWRLDGGGHGIRPECREDGAFAP